MSVAFNELDESHPEKNEFDLLFQSNIYQPPASKINKDIHYFMELDEVKSDHDHSHASDGDKDERHSHSRSLGYIDHHSDHDHDHDHTKLEDPVNQHQVYFSKRT